MKKPTAAYLLLLAVCLLLPACLQTRLQLPKAIPAETRLLRSTLKPLALQLRLSPELAAPEAGRGFQYLLIALPWGRVLTPELASDFARYLQRELALQGYYACADCSAEPIVLELSKLNINAYDYLFLRKASIVLELLIQRPSSEHATPRAQSMHEAQSEYVAFAFAPQLSRVYHQALLALAHKAIIALNLKRTL